MPREFSRASRVAEQIRRELAELIAREVNDPRLRSAIVSRVEVTRDLARREAILAGGSSGAALWAVRRLQASLDRPARIVTLFPDSGARYMSTIYNDDWMRDKGFLD